MNKILFLLLFLGFSSNQLLAQLSGLVTDEKGEPLPFVSVYLQKESVGTTSNIEGRYLLRLAPGEYQLVFQYVGYKKKVINLNWNENEQLELNVELAPLDLQAPEVVVDGSEDPAYGIIRQAMKKRKFYLNQVQNFSCEAYVKGAQEISELPESIMGQSTEEFRKQLDSSGSGMIYLSESVSKIYVQGNKVKEEMISSKVSGDDNGFSFNSGAAMMDINFYQNYTELIDSRLLSPIGQGALNAYKYKLLNTFFDEGKMIYQVQVIPKNPLGQLFFGDIYIVDGEWCIHSTDLKTTGKAANISILDTVAFKQLHVEVQDSVWRLFSQEIELGINVFGIEISGGIIGVFQQYDLAPEFPKKLFNNEIFSVEAEANKKTEVYWDSIRPLPLSEKEVVEYHIKDSLQEVLNDPAYIDSMDRVANRPSWTLLLSGYSYRKRNKGYSWSVSSPLYSIMYNTLQGFYGDVNLGYNKRFNKENTRYLNAKMKLQYGLADKRLRASGSLFFRFNKINDANLMLSGGNLVQQFVEDPPMSPLINSYTSLAYRRNYIKAYDKTFIQARYSQRLFNGLRLLFQAEYAHRKALSNQADYSLLFRDKREFYSNQALDFNQPPAEDTLAFQANNRLLLDLRFRLRFGQKYLSYPKQHIYRPSNIPEIWLIYKKALALNNEMTAFDYLGAYIQKLNLPLAGIGKFSWRTEAGAFLQTENMRFVDYQHFRGNQTFFAQNGKQWRSFQLLPYYEHSTMDYFVQTHFEHHFNGFLWNKLPGLKKLGFETILGVHHLYTPEKGNHLELNFGIDRIGWKLFRIIRIDAVMAIRENKTPDWGGVISFNFSI